MIFLSACQTKMTMKIMKNYNNESLPDLAITEIIGGTLVNWLEFMMRIVDKYQMNMAVMVVITGALIMMTMLTTLVRNQVS